MPTLAPPRPATPAPTTPTTPRRITSTPLTPPTPTITPISPTPEPTEEPRPDHRRFAVEALLPGARRCCRCSSSCGTIPRADIGS